MAGSRSLMDILYTRMQEAVKEFREPEFVGRIVLQVKTEHGEGYQAEIKCSYGAALERGPIQRLVRPYSGSATMKGLLP